MELAYHHVCRVEVFDEEGEGERINPPSSSRKRRGSAGRFFLLFTQQIKEGAEAIGTAAHPLALPKARNKAYISPLSRYATSPYTLIVLSALPVINLVPV